MEGMFSMEYVGVGVGMGIFVTAWMVAVLLHQPDDAAILNNLGAFVKSYNTQGSQAEICNAETFFENFPPEADWRLQQCKRQYKMEHPGDSLETVVRVSPGKIIIDAAVAFNHNHWHYQVYSKKTGNLIYASDTKSVEMWKKRADGQWRLVRSLAGQRKR